MDVGDRDALEKGLERILVRHGRDGLNKLMAYMGDPPDLGKVPQEFWNNYDTGMRTEITAYLQKVYVDQAEAMLASVPSIGVDWALINTAAAEWARAYGYDLVRSINDRTRKAIQAAIGRAFEEHLTRQQVEDLLTSLFGPVRAEMIAITEITRASTQGELAIAKEIADMGISMTPIWQTNNDELVCPACGPRHGQVIDDGIFPPLHPRCRCWTNHELPKVRRR